MISQQFTSRRTPSTGCFDQVLEQLSFGELFNRLHEALAVCELEYDANGTPIDAYYLDANSAYIKLFATTREEIVHHLASEVLNSELHPYLETSIRVVSEQKQERFDIFSPVRNKYFNVTVFPVRGDQFAILLIDISPWKKIERQLQHSLAAVNRSFEGAVNALSAMAAWRDPYTADHQLRVAKIARAIGEEMQLSEHELDGIYIAGLLHDIGKIGVPIEILCKPGRITEHEFHIIQSHTQIGYEILRDIDFPWLIADTVFQHHGHLDGSGYPDGLSEDNLLLSARVLTVADMVEATSSHRPYRPAKGITYALDVLTDYAGIHYDAHVVAACKAAVAHNAFSVSA